MGGVGQANLYPATSAGEATTSSPTMLDARDFHRVPRQCSPSSIDGRIAFIHRLDIVWSIPECHAIKVRRWPRKPGILCKVIVVHRISLVHHVPHRDSSCWIVVVAHSVRSTSHYSGSRILCCRCSSQVSIGVWDAAYAHTKVFQHDFVRSKYFKRR